MKTRNHIAPLWPGNGRYATVSQKHREMDKGVSISYVCCRHNAVVPEVHYIEFPFLTYAVDTMLQFRRCITLSFHFLRMLSTQCCSSEGALHWVSISYVRCWNNAVVPEVHYIETEQVCTFTQDCNNIAYHTIAQHSLAQHSTVQHQYTSYISHEHLTGEWKMTQKKM